MVGEVVDLAVSLALDTSHDLAIVWKLMVRNSGDLIVYDYSALS